MFNGPEISECCILVETIVIIRFLHVLKHVARSRYRTPKTWLRAHLCRVVLVLSFLVSRVSQD